MKSSSVNKKKSASKTNGRHETSVVKLQTVKPETSNLKSQTSNGFPIVAIGASAGGLEAMTDLLKNLQPDTGMAFIYVQHLAPHHESILASLLQNATKMKVQQATHKEKMLPDNVYVIPPDKEMFILDGHISLSPRPENPRVNLPIDILFSSLADKHKENVIGIILSGSATDGTKGLQAIKTEGGVTFAQDKTAKFESMPRSAIAAGAVDFILSPKEIAIELEHISKHPFVRSNGNGKKTGKKNGKETEEIEIDEKHPDLGTILRHLHKHTGVDFSLYKMATIKRRIQRRMLLHKAKSLKDYIKLLTEKKYLPSTTNQNDSSITRPLGGEVDLLYHDLLITVTSFFRDVEACKYLKNSLLPKLLKNKQPGEALRIWIPACSTGEEAFSIAMLLKEIQDIKYSGIPIQIFATDLSAAAVGKARIGIYTKGELEHVSPKRLQRFFTKANGNFRIAQAIRDMCVFAPHNLLSDPPFSHVDLISCCNLLIYFDAAAQKKALSTFHYSLTDDGFLVLGKSESTGQSEQLFSTINKKLKIYQRKKNSGIGTLPATDTRYSRLLHHAENYVPSPAGGGGGATFDNQIDSILLSRYTPAGVVINKQMEILQFRGDVSLFLTHTTGKASLNILKMARPEISFELRNAITQSFKTKRSVSKKNIEMNGGHDVVSLETVPVDVPMEIGRDLLLLILFTRQQVAADNAATPSDKKIKETATAASQRKIIKLGEEMSAYRDELRTITHNHEAAMEELQSANEEVVSSNEELRSMNEELETSKEEIQSVNEELSTTNQELQTRNELLHESYNFSESIISTIHDPILILDKDLRVKKANKSFYRKFGTKEEETEGMLLYDLGNGQWNIPNLRELLEDIIPKNSQVQDFEVEHDFKTMGKKIMLLNARRVVQAAHREQLILLSIADITEIRKLAVDKELIEKKAKIISDTYKAADVYIRNVFNQAPVSIVVYKGPSFIVDMINEKAQEMWGTTYKKVIGKPLFEVSPELQQGMEAILTKVYTSGEPHIAHEFSSQYERNGKLYDGFFNFVLNPVHDLNGTIIGITSIGTDVTQEVTARKKIEESEKRYNMMMMQSPFAFAILKGKEMVITLANDSIKNIWGKGKDVEGKPLLEVLPEIKDQPFPELLDKVYTTGTPFLASEILAHLRHNGKMQDMYFNLVYQPYREVDNSISGVVVIAVDVTREVVAKKASQEANAKLAAIVQFSEDAIISKTVNGIITSWNPGAKKLFGYTEEEMIGQPITKLIPKDRLDEEPKILKRIHKGETVDHFETKRVTKDGKFLDISLTISPIKDSEGNITGASKIARDITEQTEALKKIEESEAFNRTVLESSPDCVKVIDAEGRLQFMNTNGMCIFEIDDFTPFRNKPWSELWGEENRHFVIDAIDTAMSGKTAQFQAFCPTAKGTPKWWDVMVSPVQQPGSEKISSLISVSRDITQQMEVRKKIDESEAKYRSIFETSEVSLWEEDFTEVKAYIDKLKQQGIKNFGDFFTKHPGHVQEAISLIKVLDVNKASVKMFEAAGKSELLGSLPDIFTAESLPVLIKELVTVAEGETFMEGEAMLNTVKGNPIYVLFAMRLSFPTEKECRALFSVVDISERNKKVNEIKMRSLEFENAVKQRTAELQKANEALQKTNAELKQADEQLQNQRVIVESEKNLRNILEGLPQLAWRSSPDGMEIFFNRQWYDYTGQTEEESANEGWTDTLHPDDREWAYPKWRKTLEDKTSLELEFRLRAKDGNYHWFLTRAEPFFDADNNVWSYIGTCTNIDAAKRIQAELELGKQRREDFIKMASHELKTPITTIKGYIQLVLSAVKDEEKEISPLLIKSSLLTMEKQVGRLARLMSELLDLSRIESGQLDLHKETFSLNELVIEMVQDILYTNSDFSIDLFHDHECSLYADRDRIGQVIINLLNNAIKYSPNSHKIIVQVWQQEKNLVAVSVKDKGIGIDKKDQEKIFDRFFRTEGKSEQTYPGFGVGLFLSLEIIQRHNGSITVESEKSKGSTFTFTLPVDESKK